MPGLPQVGAWKFQVFNCAQGATGIFQQWTKPLGASMIWLMAYGPGGGGGGGFTRVINTAGGGGGGGGQGGRTTIMVPAFQFPDEAWIRVGAGGAGGAANTNGSVGIDTHIKFRGITTGAVADFILVGTSGGGGGAGTGAAGGAGGAAGSAQTIGNQLSFLGMFISATGTAGGAGGAQTGAAGAAVTWGGGGIPGSPGSGGGGSTGADFAGGAINIAGPLTNTIAGGVANGGAGSPGILMPFGFSCGGTGGGSKNNGVGGAGGQGSSPGSGGGGGGTGTTGGAGGAGGDGLVVIGWM